MPNNEHQIDMTTTAYYATKSHPNSMFTPEQSYQIGQGMMGGPNGTYGKYQMGPNEQRSDFKQPRQRQTGE